MNTGFMLTTLLLIAAIMRAMPAPQLADAFPDDDTSAWVVTLDHCDYQDPHCCYLVDDGSGIIGQATVVDGEIVAYYHWDATNAEWSLLFTN